MGFHTTVSVLLLILTASVWRAAGVTHTCPVLPGSPGRDGRDGRDGAVGPPGPSAGLDLEQIRDIVKLVAQEEFGTC